MQRPYLFLAHVEDCSLSKMVSPPYSKSRSYFQSRSGSQWWLLRLVNVHCHLGLGYPDLSEGTTARCRAQTTPRELWVLLSCLNPEADVARAQQFRVGHTPGCFCNQNCSSPSISQFLLLRSVMWDQNHHGHTKQGAGPAQAHSSHWNLLVG